MSLPRTGVAGMIGNLPMGGYRATGAADAVAEQDYVTLGQMQAALSEVRGFFPGLQIVDTVTSAAAPAGWLYANGQTVSRTTYAALWARVQAGNNLAATQADKTAGQYGPGNGSTTFTLPNLYADGGYFIRPISSGRAIGTVQADEIQAHTHNGTTEDDGLHTHTVVESAVTGFGSGTGLSGGSDRGVVTVERGTSQAGLHDHDFTTNSTGGTETRPQNIAYPVLIKT